MPDSSFAILPQFEACSFFRSSACLFDLTAPRTFYSFRKCGSNSETQTEMEAWKRKRWGKKYTIYATHSISFIFQSHVVIAPRRSVRWPLIYRILMRIDKARRAHACLFDVYATRQFTHAVRGFFVSPFRMINESVEMKDRFD